MLPRGTCTYNHYRSRKHTSMECSPEDQFINFDLFEVSSFGVSCDNVVVFREVASRRVTAHPIPTIFHRVLRRPMYKS